MIKKHYKKLCIVGIIFGVIIFPSFVFVIGNYIGQNNFIFSHQINKTLYKFFPKSQYLQMKIADYYYQLGDYEKAIQKYKKVECDDKNLCQKLGHNLGNAYYRVGEYLNNQDKFQMWTFSLQSYNISLQILFHTETKANYDFVYQKLSDLKNEMEKQKEDNTKKQDEKENQTEDNEQPNQEPPKSDTESDAEEKSNDAQKEQNTPGEKIIPKAPSMEIYDTDGKISKPFLKDEEKQIQQYIEDLKNEEKENIHLNKPKENTSIEEILKNDFFDNPFKIENDW